MLKCTSTISKYKDETDCMRKGFTIPTSWRVPSLKTRDCWIARGTTMRNFLMKLWKRLCLNLFSQGEWKSLADPMASCCTVKWVLTFSALLKCYIQSKLYKNSTWNVANFYREMLMKVIKQWICLRKSWCRMHLRNYSRQYVFLLRNFFPESLNLDRQWEVASSEISYPSLYRNVTEGIV